MYPDRERNRQAFCSDPVRLSKAHRRADDTVGNTRRAQTFQFEIFELILSLKLDKRFPVEQFEATVIQSTVSSPPC